MMFSWNRFRMEMRLGRIITDAHERAVAIGFRGNQKGGGFKGLAKKNGITVRQAYRLMRKYQRVVIIIHEEMMQTMMLRKHESNDDKERVTNAGRDHTGQPISVKTAVTNEQEAQL